MRWRRSRQLAALAGVEAMPRSPKACGCAARATAKMAVLAVLAALRRAAAATSGIREPSLEDVFFGFSDQDLRHDLRQILTLAAKEFRDRMRNRWVLAVALVFTVFSLVITYFGGAQQGTIGLRSIEFTIASLVSLVIYLIPLIALLLGFDAIVGERERGSLDLLLAIADHARWNCCSASTLAWQRR